MTGRGNRRLGWTAAVAGVALFLASGCTGDDSAAEQKVATLTGPGTPTQPAATGVDDRRPLVRLDMEDQEREVALVYEGDVDPRNLGSSWTIS